MRNSHGSLMCVIRDGFFPTHHLSLLKDSLKTQVFYLIFASFLRSRELLLQDLRPCISAIEPARKELGNFHRDIDLFSWQVLSVLEAAAKSS